MTSNEFNCAHQGLWSWMQRAEVCADLLLDIFPSGEGVAVSDIGCGDGKLEPLLRKGGLVRTYQGYDIRPQSDKVIPFDVHKDQLPKGFDVIVMLGVIEYLNELPTVLTALSAQAPYLVLSHVIKQSDEYTPERRKELGWLNHLSRDELTSCLATANYDVMQARMDKENKTILIACRSRIFTP
jgi:hypothetical protein